MDLNVCSYQCDTEREKTMMQITHCTLVQNEIVSFRNYSEVAVKLIFS